MSKFKPEYGELFHQRLIKVYNKYYEFDPQNNQNLAYCKHVVLQAYREIFYDMNFISTRRLINGTGRCKLAGVIMWRLYKSNFARFKDTTTCNRSNNSINPVFEISLLFILLHVLKVNPEEIRSNFTKVLQELEYQLRSQHINQESIALVFKTICQAEKLLDSSKGNCCEK